MRWLPAARPRSTWCSTPWSIMADKLLKYKYVVKQVARRHNMVATFMPKPLFGDNGSGMHVHQSLWKGNTNIMYDEKGYGGLSQNALYYIGGLLKHAPALCAFIAPTVNSYKRLTPGFRGAGQPGVQPAQPFGLLPYPALFQEREGQACRVPHAGPVLQPLPGLPGHADGRFGRDPEQDRSGQAA